MSAPRGEESDSDNSPERKRSLKIKHRLIEFLNLEAVPRGYSLDQILKHAPGWIDHNDPPQEVTVKRWMKIYTGESYPYRFDINYRIYLDVETSLSR